MCAFFSLILFRNIETIKAKSWVEKSVFRRTIYSNSLGKPVEKSAAHQSSVSVISLTTAMVSLTTSILYVMQSKRMNGWLVRNVFSVRTTFGKTSKGSDNYSQSKMSDKSSCRALCWGKGCIFIKSLSNPVFHLCQRFDLDLDKALRWGSTGAWNCTRLHVHAATGCQSIAGAAPQSII